ncbi:ABC transporter permease [Vreelandella boliviensis]|uniref:Osmoprotectant uptake system permease n=1 Tax=Vreelandella boliviensis LC1 TaxID=1072583 RepID=A0A265DUC5_9GAMM|nr:ABC transporter permease [Halomonas boliviensis]EHJ91834.1 Putative osmoprotectant uptake system permease protein yehW [Halomonas boliviensis LC1]OZT72885.1 osmoprotectant uptake system permease [Halomonas boliviensis LC1]
METRVNNSLSVAQPHTKAPQWLWPLMWGALLLGSVTVMSAAEPLFRWIEPDARQVIYERTELYVLLGRHLFVVGIAAVVTIIVGVAAGIAVTRRWGSDFLPLVAQLASLGQTFPPVAVLALAVPVLGFGTLPIIVALMLYGLLPIVRNTLAGLQGVEDDIKTAAHAMGMTPRQILRQVELPLAAPVILAGIRTSVTINIATAALGATVGASNLGDPIISGIVNGNMAYVAQGALTIALLALTIDSLFEVLQRQLRTCFSAS